MMALSDNENDTLVEELIAMLFNSHSQNSNFQNFVDQEGDVALHEVSAS